MAFEQRLIVRKKAKLMWEGEEQSSRDSQVAGPRNSEKGGVFRAEKVRRA